MLGVTLLVCLWAALSAAAPEKEMDVLYRWKTLDFVFPDDETESSYNASTAFPLDVDTSPFDPKGRFFVTVPRYLPGVPATLTTVKETRDGPKLDAYPSWDANKQGDCDNALTSVVRVRADECGRLWVVDSGVVDYLVYQGRKDLCPAQLLVFNLKDDKLLWKYPIPTENLVLNKSLIVNVAVDNQYGCNNPYAYVADARGNGLIVVQVTITGTSWIGTSWRFEGYYFENNPGATHFSVNGAIFYLPDGVTSLALSPVTSLPLSPVTTNFRFLYFHSLAGVDEFAVTNLDLQKSGFTLIVGQGQQQLVNQSGPAAMAGSILFLSDLGANSLMCWNYNTTFESENIIKVYQDDVKFQFATGLKAVKEDDKYKIYALTNRFQNIIVGEMDEDDWNYRILSAPVSRLISDTKCGEKSKSDHPGNITIS